MPILGPDGEVLEAARKPRMGVAAGASLQLTMRQAGTIETETSVLEFEPGVWVIVPMEKWQRMMASAMQAETEVLRLEDELAACQEKPKRRH